MSEMSMKVLEVVIENAAKPAEEIINAVCRAFPRESYALLESYIYQLRGEGYLSIMKGDNRIVAIRVNPSAYIALRESKNAPEEKSSTQISIGSIGNVSGQIAIGNKGGSYDMRVSKNFIRSVAGDFREIIPLIESQASLNPFEREQLKKDIQQVLVALEKSELPPQGIIARIDAFLQKHSWLSAPIASTFLNALTKLFQ